MLRMRSARSSSYTHKVTSWPFSAKQGRQRRAPAASTDYRDFLDQFYPLIIRFLLLVFFFVKENQGFSAFDYPERLKFSHPFCNPGIMHHIDDLVNIFIGFRHFLLEGVAPGVTGDYAHVL